MIEENIDEEVLQQPIDDNFRDEAIQALKTLNRYVTESSPFAQAVKKPLNKTQNEILDLLAKHGYDKKSAAVLMAVSLLVDNLSRL
ncbi:MAG TPA: hypothetical protein PK705_07705 [Clostridia bacterium]|nr:hypothetical protein [Clostridia bacterium]